MARRTPCATRACFSFACVMVACACSRSIQPAPGRQFDPSSVVVAGNEEVDVNGDGIADGVRVDTNGDGQWDVIVTDTDGDGTGDRVLFPHQDGTFGGSGPAPSAAGSGGGTSSLPSVDPIDPVPVVAAGGTTASESAAGSNSGAAEAGGAEVSGAGTGGATSEGPPRFSAGCGLPLPPGHAVSTVGTRDGYQEYHVQQTGENLVNADPNDAVDRLFWVRVPPDYDPDRPYEVVYLLQGCGGGNGRDNVYPLFNEAQGGSEQRIYVAVALPPNQPNGPCYDNQAGSESMEWEAFALFHEVVSANYCVDQNEVYVAGYSTGGWLANMWGCYFAGPNPLRKFGKDFSIRGQLAVTGGLPSLPECSGPVAGLWIHDSFDNANPIAGNYEARDRVLTVNGCLGSAEAPWGQDDLSTICVQYVDCPEAYPVVFCTTEGYGHSDQANLAIPAFTQFLDQIGN